MYTYICSLAISHLVLLTGETNFPRRAVRCADTKDSCFLCSYASIIVISDSHKQDMKGTVNRIMSLFFFLLCYMDKNIKNF